MNEPVRLFFAIEVPEETRDEIARFGETLDRNWKPSRPGQLHITLAFMGAVAPDDLAKVIQIGEDAARDCSGFSLGISDTSVFPESGEPRVLYAQVDGGQPLLDLAQALRNQLADMADQKKIKPHLTLARSRAGKAARKVLRKFKGSWPVSDFVLFKSVLAADVVVHEPVQRFKLARPAF